MISPATLLDINVPMYAAGQPHTYKDSCSWLMREIAAGRLEVSLDAECIQEVLYRFGALRQWQIAVTMAENLLDLVPTIYPILPVDARLAVQLFQRYAPEGVRARDLLHAAVMLNNGLYQIISTDRHFDRIEGITRLDPQELFAQAQ